MNRDNWTESLWEGNLGTSASERVSKRLFSEVFRDFSEVFRDFERFSETLSEADFPSQRLSALLPLIVLPLELSCKFRAKL